MSSASLLSIWFALTDDGACYLKIRAGHGRVTRDKFDHGCGKLMESGQMYELSIVHGY